MKKIKLLSILMVLLLVSSCEKFLDLESPDAVLQDNVFNSIDGLRSARIGMYSALAEKDYYGGFFPLAMEAHSDNGANGGYAVNAYDELGTYKSVSTANVVIEKMWLSIYNPITISNRILANIDNVKGGDDVETKELKNIKGEALFVRALCHFDALRVWGEHWDQNSEYGIPVIKKPLSFDETPSRNTVKQSYDAIIDDIAKAADLVEDNLGDDDVFKGKIFATKDACKALWARVCIYGGDKPTAAKYADEVIQNGKDLKLYDSADYGKVFTVKESQESIFELGFNAQSRSSYNQLTYVRPAAARPEVIFLLSSDLGEFFKKRTSDARARTTNYSDNDASISPDGRSEKYRGEQTRDNPAYIFRLADMYLIAAEAKGRINGLTDLNAIRNARGMASFEKFTTDADFDQAIADERRAEFHSEGHRYFDLARTGKVQDAMEADTKSNFPIPLREITASNGIIKQNKGY